MWMDVRLWRTGRIQRSERLEETERSFACGRRREVQWNCCFVLRNIIFGAALRLASDFRGARHRAEHIVLLECSLLSSANNPPKWPPRTPEAATAGLSR